MGLFSFLKSVGEKLVGGGDAAPKAEDVKKSIDAHRLGTENVSVALEGDTVKLSGTVKDQAAYEKAVLAAGNSLGIATVDTSALTVENEEAAAPVFYTVKKGDTLWKIAEEQYGKGQGAKHTIIFEANTPMLTSPDKIYPGQVLRIPPLE
ncbi:peptidoglycan-binding protein LysM [Desulfovibrio sp. OttesenSCG-928-I05]|nr:peptidoglycan-binding protein LysM [Desulfovibrio sp. OttesenSCG-928-I05]